jgi:hypothetical protein
MNRHSSMGATKADILLFALIRELCRHPSGILPPNIRPLNPVPRALTATTSHQPQPVRRPRPALVAGVSNAISVGYNHVREFVTGTESIESDAEETKCRKPSQLQ